MSAKKSVEASETKCCIYGTRANRSYLKSKGIRFAGKPVGRPRKQTPENAAEIKAERKQRQSEYRQWIPIEGKFGQGKSGYRFELHKSQAIGDFAELGQQYILGDEPVGAVRAILLAQKSCCTQPLGTSICDQRHVRVVIKNASAPASVERT